MKKILLIIVAFSGIIADASAQTSVGTIEGSLEVAATGHATYTIPVRTLKGVGSLAPAIALSYSSVETEGAAGVGWNLSGMSAITRGGQTIYHNGIVKPLKNNGEDNFYLDGDLLMPVSGNNGDNGTVYSTHSESFIKVESFGGTGGNPEWWKITMKDGSIYEYGRQPVQRLNTGNSIVAWHISSVTDINNNTIIYDYTQSDVLEIQLNRIDYSGNSLEFSYINKTNPNIYFINGKPIANTKLINKIYVKQNSQTVFTYQLNFQVSYLRSYLTSLDLIASDNVSKMTTNFSYGYLNDNEHINFINQNYQNDKQNVVLTVGDFNGNGRSDVIAMEQNAVAANNKIDRVKSASYKLISDIGEPTGTLLELTKNYQEANYSNPKIDFGLPFTTYSSDYDGMGKDGFLWPLKEYHIYKDSRGDDHEDGMDSTSRVFIDKFTSDGTSLQSYTYDLGIPRDMYLNKYQFYLKDANSFAQGDFNGDGKIDIISILGRKYKSSEIIEKNGTCSRVGMFIE